MGEEGGAGAMLRRARWLPPPLNEEGECGVGRTEKDISSWGQGVGSRWCVIVVVVEVTLDDMTTWESEGGADGARASRIGESGRRNTCMPRDTSKERGLSITPVDLSLRCEWRKREQTSSRKCQLDV